MPKQIKRTVDEHLPKWLHSRFLSAVDYIWQVKGDNEESIRRVDNLMNSGHFTDEENTRLYYKYKKKGLGKIKISKKIENLIYH